MADLLCFVCGDGNAQNHYGTTCCPSCKGFFRRVFVSSKNLECYRGNCCEITKETRNTCRACRYKKCLAVGMNALDIRHRSENESPVFLPEIEAASSLASSSTNSDHLAQPTVLEEAETLCNSYLNLEKFCESASSASSGLMEEDSLIDRMFDATPSELIAKTSAQCPRFPRIWKPREFVDVFNFRRSWARDVVNMVDWMNHFLPFKRLSEDDKVKMLTGRFTQFSLLTKAFRTYKEGCSGLVFGCGNVFPYESSSHHHIVNDHLRTMLARVSNSLFAEVIFPMSYLQFAESEYVLMKANLLLHEGISFNTLSPEGRAIVSAEHSRHREAMLNLLMTKNNSFDDSLNHIILTENMSNCIETVANYMDKEIQFMQFFNIGGLDRELVRQLHVNKYVCYLG